LADRARLLVVDDDPDVLLVLKTKLEQTGRFEVFAAAGARTRCARRGRSSPS
jgi:CheY-like chemotaxis protein